MTARFGSVGGSGLQIRSVTFNANNFIRLTDAITGKFLGGQFQKALAEAHEAMAIRVQQGSAKHVQRSISPTRKQRGGERLATSLLDDRNRRVTASGFKVHVESWLDESPAAKYYRRIEEGDPHEFITYGVLFTDDFAKFYGPRRDMRSHMRMPQFQRQGSGIIRVGPFPAFQYVRAGRDALDRLDPALVYRKALKQLANIDIDAQLK